MAGMEYTFSLTVWKAGCKEEATNQTVGAARPSATCLGQPSLPAHLLFSMF